MKKILFLFVLALLPTVAGATPNPTPETSYFTLYGDLISSEKTTIMVFQYDTTVCNWEMIEEIRTKKNYQLLLDPLQAYQIWFQSPNGYTRIIYVDPGDAGIWQKNFSMGFSEKSLAFIHMYQTCNEQGLAKYDIEYLNSKHQAETELPATNCYNCIPEDPSYKW